MIFTQVRFYTIIVRVHIVIIRFSVMPYVSVLHLSSGIFARLLDWNVLLTVDIRLVLVRH